LDGAYQRVVSLQITPDIVIGDFDSINVLEKNPNVSYIKDDNQENTDLEKALDHLVAKGYSDVNIVWATGNRLDHTINNFATLAKYPKVNIVVYDDHSRAFILPKSYKKHYNEGTKISLIPIHTASGINTKNLLHELNGESLTFGQRSGTSNNAIKSGVVEITYQEGILALVESTD
jgi:thiamine pyrophosphokinase